MPLTHFANASSLIPPNDILGRKTEIKDCVAADNMEEAVRRLIDFVRDFCIIFEDDVILISRQYYAVQKKERRRSENNDLIELTKSQIAEQILLTLREAYNQIIQV